MKGKYNFIKREIYRYKIEKAVMGGNNKYLIRYCIRRVLYLTANRIIRPIERVITRKISSL